MRSEKSIGRMVGVLLLAHLAAGLIVPFVMLDKVRRPPGFLENAAASPDMVRAAVLLLFAGSAIAIGISVTAYPVFRRHASGQSIWLLAMAVAWFALQAVDNVALLSMLSLSEEYAKAGAARADLFEALNAVVGSIRRWAHFT
ncbi:MAG: DUF4386 family protein, partial [Gemmatimonadetes bacterium]|nr:DUF4386 family protein [Gemmatimonadota bacterium]